MICQCGDDGHWVHLMSGGYYYCRSCKDEIRLQLPPTRTGYYNFDPTLTPYVVPHTYQDPNGNIITRIGDHELEYINELCKHCSMTLNELFQGGRQYCPGKK